MTASELIQGNNIIICFHFQEKTGRVLQNKIDHFTSLMINLQTYRFKLDKKFQKKEKFYIFKEPKTKISEKIRKVDNLVVGCEQICYAFTEEMCCLQEILIHETEDMYIHHY